MNITIMPKHISTLNTLWIIHYLHEFHPSIDTDAIIANINQKTPFYIENLDTGKVEMVSVKHLSNPNYWLSNKFMMAFYNEIKSQIDIPRLGYKIGRMAHQAQPISKAAILVPLIGPQRLLKRLVRESAKFNQTKDSVLISNNEGHAVIRLIHHDGILMDDFGMDWHAGVFYAYAELSGAKNIKIEWTQKDPQYKVVDFDIYYEKPDLISRLYRSLVFKIPIVKDALTKAEAIQHEHRITIFNQEKIIKERTEEIKSMQNKLLEQERHTTERHIAGGMAHEIRNALGAAKLWTWQTMQKEEKASSIDYLTSIIRVLKSGNGLSEFEHKKAVQAFRSLHERQKALNKGINDIDEAIDRSLKITYRVLSYASLTSQSQHDIQNTDFQKIASEFAQLYNENPDGVEIRVELNFKEKLFTKCPETQIHLILQNLLRNAYEAIKDSNIERGLIKIRGSKDENNIILEIADNGPGVPEEDQENIFHPFFTTKPSTGMGLGLNECQKMINAMGGRIEFEGRPGNGSIFRLFIPIKA